jgi:hypothetical protein
MAVLAYTDLKNLMLDRCQANVSTDAPADTNEILRFLNEAYADVWEISGGSLKSVTSPVAWNSAQTATGIVIGLLTDVKDIVRLWATSTPTVGPLSSGTTINTPNVTSSALFGSVVVGMTVSGTGIPANTTVKTVSSTSAIVLSDNATGTATVDLTFGKVTGEYELVQRDYDEIAFWRTRSGFGSYSIPKIYAVTRQATTTPAQVGILRLDYYPGTTAYYFPMQYVPQFTQIDASTVTTPDVNDLESRDIGLLAAARLAQVIGRAELVPGILGDVSNRTAAALKRKMEAMVSASQSTP